MKIKDLKELASILGVRLNALYFHAFLAKNSYQDFYIAKRTGKSPRKISAPTKQLKFIQNRILDRVLEPSYKVPGGKVFGIKAKGFLENADAHSKPDQLLNIDIQDFFPSITSGRIRKLFEKSATFRFDPIVSAAMCNLLCHDGSLPQGAPTSPILANMICFRLDKTFSSFAEKHKLRYTRYFDDITLSSSGDALTDAMFMDIVGYVISKKGSTLHPKSIVREMVNKEWFEINGRKIRLQTKGRSQWVTGVKVNVRPNVSRGYIRYIRCILHDWEANGYRKANARFASKHYSSLERGLAGMIQHVNHVRSHPKKNTDQLALKLLKRMKSLPIST